MLLKNNLGIILGSKQKMFKNIEAQKNLGTLIKKLCKIPLVS